MSVLQRALDSLVSWSGPMDPEFRAPKMGQRTVEVEVTEETATDIYIVLRIPKAPVRKGLIPPKGAR